MKTKGFIHKIFSNSFTQFFHSLIPRVPSPLTPLPQCKKGVAAKAFTLVELIVVITILAILGTISFISLQNYSKEARDSKRIQDVRSLLTKLNVENVKGTPYADMLTGTTVYDKQINGNQKSVTNGILNFELLRESQSNFQDPESKGDYDFANAVGESNGEGYNFIEGRYYSEKNNEEVIMGNYYQFQPSDAEHLFRDTLIGPSESIYTPPSGVHTDGNDLIVSDGTNSITIRDRNVGATAVYSGTENSAVRGSYFQWGNKYEFPNSGAITTSSTLINAGSNGASTYSSSTFTFGSGSYRYDWTTTQNNNLWGDTTNTNVARIGPCPSGYHIPSKEEWKQLISIWFTSKGQTCNPSEGGSCSWTGTATLANFQSELKIPLSGHRYRDGGTVDFQGTDGGCWSSSPSSVNTDNASYFYFGSIGVYPQNYDYRAYGLMVRCFKN